MFTTEIRLVSIKEACTTTNQSRTTLWKRLNSDPTFPKLVQIGRRKSFVSTELQEWVRQQIAARDEACAE